MKVITCLVALLGLVATADAFALATPGCVARSAVRATVQDVQMGRGDRRTKKGKIAKGSFGKSRPGKSPEKIRLNKPASWAALHGKADEVYVCMRVRGAHLGLHSLRALALSWLLRRELLHRATRAPRQPCSSSHCDGPPGVSAWGSISVSPMAMRRWLAQLESGGRTLCRTPRPANHCSVLYGLLDITGCWGRSAASTMPGATGMIMHWASAAKALHSAVNVSEPPTPAFTLCGQEAATYLRSLLRAGATGPTRQRLRSTRAQRTADCTSANSNTLR
eukprot:CAMPEP_0185540038 /NCGR_PEP_ID=MMETSP1381-20130426/912_1 /TAXON_ID=298111 /ORGANISM="Pavlova sp., Strain CCMP459" /LENGTH=277 /DNA_ID=CAMNT_0028151811 /DNA_START=29 /DNA_END=864 /DNA_ORIENTATION=+